MKNSFLGRFSAAALACALMASSAAAQSYVCNLKSNGEGFISPTIGLVLDSSGKSGLVYDAIIHYVHEKPIPARIKKMNNGDIRFSWNLNVPARPDRARISYRAMLNPETKTVQVVGKIRHATNHVGGQGRCQLGKLKGTG